MKVDVYFNLHRQVFSIRAREGPQAGRVIRHGTPVLLHDVSFVVQPKGRRRVLETGHKTVHAFARGTLEDGWHEQALAELPIFEEKGRKIYYAPPKGETFIDKRTGDPIFRATRAVLNTHQGRPQVWALT